MSVRLASSVHTYVPQDHSFNGGRGREDDQSRTVLDIWGLAEER